MTGHASALTSPSRWPRHDDSHPWHFATSAYEADKYGATLASLPKLRYRRGLEVGCSAGVLTERLARRCHSLLAVDMVELTLERARRRCTHAPGVAFERMHLPDELPDGRFDLILLSEVGHYWTAGDLDRIAAFTEQALEPGGDIVLLHWVGEADGPLSGDRAAQRFVTATRGFCHVLHQARRERYRIDVLQRGGETASTAPDREQTPPANHPAWQSTARVRTAGERPVLRFGRDATAN